MKEFLQINLFQAGCVLCKRQRVNHHLHIGQNGQIVLLAVAEALAGDTPPRDEQGGPLLLGLTSKGDAGRSACLQYDIVVKLGNSLVGIRVDEHQSGFAVGRLLTGVEDACRERSLVALPYKAWHVRLYHHVFLGHRFCPDNAIVHVGVVAKAHEPPCGEALGQGESHGHVALVVSQQGRVEEGCLVQVLAHLLRGSAVTAAIVACGCHGLCLIG